VAPPLERDGAEHAARWFAAGSGFAAHSGMGSAHEFSGVDASLRPDAMAIATLALPVLRVGGGVAAALALPLYVRDRVALTTAERAAGMRL
jgi:tRNA threonylcarbamoyladenosine biosynthesis protein TsaB